MISSSTTVRSDVIRSLTLYGVLLRTVTTGLHGHQSCLLLQSFDHCHGQILRNVSFVVGAGYFEQTSGLAPEVYRRLGRSMSALADDSRNEDTSDPFLPAGTSFLADSDAALSALPPEQRQFHSAGELHHHCRETAHHLRWAFQRECLDYRQDTV